MLTDIIKMEKKTAIVFEDLGLIEYKKAWEYQEKIHKALVEAKLNRSMQQSPAQNHLLFCEHPHVYTLGKSGVQNNLLINDAFLQKIDATYYKSDRGGDITYHGPGQIVGYPILDLEPFHLSVKNYIFKLEEAIINTLADFKIKSERLEGATGVWIDTSIPSKARKICAIGVRISRYVTMHGFALNVNTNLEYFSYINPCGFVDKGVTSISKELGKPIEITVAKKHLHDNILKVFAEV
jgi:lipoyl(octanoyl) transferase